MPIMTSERNREGEKIRKAKSTGCKGIKRHRVKDSEGEN